jgi:hypothetical protein
MKTLFIAAGDITWGSSRMRAFWPAKYMGADVITWQDAVSPGVSTDYDVYIFQKQCDLALNELLLGQGKQVWWDVCDPSWWFEPKKCLDRLQHVTGVVASSEAMANDFSEWSGRKCYTIPDRLELSHFPLKAVHRDTDCVKLIWFGVSVNRWSLLNATDNLNRLQANGYKYELTIMDNQPEIDSFNSDLPIHPVRWKLDKENEILAQHDIALLPPYPGPWGKVKSNNKQLTAWACGLAVTDGQNYAQLEALIKSADARRENAQQGAYTIEREHYTAEYSAQQWQRILEPVQKEVMFIGRR